MIKKKEKAFSKFKIFVLILCLIVSLIIGFACTKFLNFEKTIFTYSFVINAMFLIFGFSLTSYVFLCPQIKALPCDKENILKCIKEFSQDIKIFFIFIIINLIIALLLEINIICIDVIIFLLNMTFYSLFVLGLCAFFDIILGVITIIMHQNK